MSFSTFLRALRSRLYGSAGERSRSRSKTRAGRRPFKAHMDVERLEERALLAVIPPAIVNNQLELTSPFVTGDDFTPIYSSPVVAIDPLNPNKVVLAYSNGSLNLRSNPNGRNIGGDNLEIQYSNDGGKTWLFGDSISNQLDPTSPFPTAQPFNYRRVSKPSIAFDRSENFYVVDTEHADSDASGAVVFHAYNFSGATPFNTVQDNNLYQWAVGDAAYNPVVAVDTSVPFFKDPTTGRVQLDPAAGKAVYVAWNTLVGAAGTANTASVVHIAASSDRGRSFTGETQVNDFVQYFPPPNTNPPVFTHDSSPALTFSQGTADGRVAGGQVTVSWFHNANNTDFNSATPHDSIQSDSFNSGALPPVAAVFTAGQTPLRDGIATSSGPHGDGVTDIPFVVNITDPSFDLLSDLNVSLSMAHANPDQLSIDLISPIPDANGQPISVRLLVNRVDNSGTTIGNPPIGLPANDGVGAFVQRNNGFVVGYREAPTVFDDEAVRSIVDTSVANPQPWVGHFRPSYNQSGGHTLSEFYGRRPQDLNGTWILRIIDHRNSGNTPPPQQFLSSAKLTFSSRLDNSRFGTDRTVTSNAYDVARQPFPGNVVHDSGTYNYSLKSTFSNAAGIGPGIVLASDNTLGSFSGTQGRIYLAYTGNGRVFEENAPANVFNALQRADNTDIFLYFSDDGGKTWNTHPTPFAGLPTPVNDDAIIAKNLGDDFSDNYSEGNRAQFQPAIAVDPVTGTLAVSFVDGRHDAGRARTVITLTTSIDGGASFSQQVAVNQRKTAIDAITRQTVTLEPIPTNLAAAFGPENGALEHGLAIYGGTIIPVWAGNLNGAYSGLLTSEVHIAAGPRIIDATMGPVNGAGQVTQGTLVGDFNNTTTADGQRVLNGFVVTFDRPIDPATLTPANITLLYRSPTTPAGQPGTLIPSDQITVTAVDNVGGGGAVAVSPSAFVGDAVTLKGTSGTTQAIFSVSLSFPLVADVTIAYATSDGTAVAGRDYVATSGTVTIKAGQTRATFAVPVIGNTLAGGNVTFNVTLSNPTGGVQLGRATGVGTILNDAAAPSLSVGDVTVLNVTSGTVGAVFQVFLSTASSQNVTVRYTTADGDALAGRDYVAVSGTLTFAPGETIKTVTVPVIGDPNPDPNRTFYLDISTATVAVVDRRRGTATIVNGAAAPNRQVSVGDVTVQEGNSGLTRATFTVFLDVPSSRDLTVTYKTSDGTAVAGTDYQALTGTLTIPAGQTRGTFSVNVIGNTTPQSNRTFVVDLSSPSAGFVVTRGRAFGTIVDDDGLPTVTIGDVSVLEGNAGLTAAVFPVQLSSASSQPVVITYQVVSGTAVAGTDYRAVVGNTFTIPAGQTTGSITVNVIGNLTPQDNRTFTVQILNAAGASVATSAADGSFVDTGTGTIIDDDGATAISVTNAASGPFSGGTTFTVFMSTTTTQTITVAYATADGSARAGTDYQATAGTLTFNPGDISKTVFVPGLFSAATTGPLTFTLNLSGPVGASLARRQGVGTIIGSGPNIYVSDAVVAEGNAGTTPVTFTVFLDQSPAVGSQVTVNYATADDTARDGKDYNLASGTLTFLPGQSSQTITVNVLGNTAFQADRRFNVVLSNAVGGSVQKGTGVGTILDDDGPAPAIYISDAIGLEATGGSLVFTAVLTKPSPVEQRVDYVTANVSARAGADFGFTKNTLFIPAGTTRVDIPVPLILTAKDTPPLTFLLQLSNASVPLLRDHGVGTIVNSRARGPEVAAVSDAAVLEGSGAGVTLMNFNVVSTGLVTISYSTSDGSAVGGVDYTPTIGTITIFGNGTISVPVLHNNTPQTNRTFFLNLTRATNGTLITNSAKGTIIDDDVNVSIGDAGNFESFLTSGNAIQFPITIDRPVPGFQLLTVTVNTQSGTAVAGRDFVAVTNGTATILAGQTVGTLTVNTIGNDVPEANKLFSVRVTAPTTGTVRRGVASGIIVNDDTSSVVVTVGGAEAPEGTANRPSTLNFPVFIDRAPGGPLTLSYITQDGAAVSGVDYVGVPNGQTRTITIPAGVRNATIPIALIPNASLQGDRDFKVTLISVSGGGAISPSPGNDATGIILEDDFAPNITVGNVLVTRSDTGAVNATFTATLSAPNLFQDVTLTYATADGTAIQNVDYVPLPAGTLIIPLGQTSATFSISVLPSQVTQGLKKFFVNLSGATGGTLLTPVVEARIQDNHDVQVSVGDATVLQSGSAVVPTRFNVFLSRASSQPITVTYATADASATQGVDYQPLMGTVTFQPGETVKTITVNVIGDSALETTEFFALNLTGVTGAGILRGEGIGTIIEADNIPISVSDATVQEGNSGTKDVTFTVFLSSPAPTALTVNYTTVDGTATAANNDYIPVSGTISFAAGQSSASFVVKVVGNTKVEADKGFTVRLSNPSVGTLVKAIGTATILNDDFITAVVSAGDTSVAQGGNATFTVFLNYPVRQDVLIDYTTADGTGRAGVDYVATSGTLTIPNGATSATISVRTLTTAALDGNKTFTINLSNGRNAGVARAQGTATIINGNHLGLTLGDTSVREGNGGITTATFTAYLSQPSADPVSFRWGTTGGTGVPLADYNPNTDVVTIPAGAISATFSIQVLGNTNAQPNRTVEVTLSNPVGAGLIKAKGTLTIVDDDTTAPELTLGAATAVKAGGGTSQAQFPVYLSSPSTTDVTVRYATADGSAVAGVDYRTTSGTLVIPAGQTSATINVDVLGNAALKGNLNFTVTLSNATGATIRQAAAAATIVDTATQPFVSLGDVTLLQGQSGLTPATFTVYLNAPSDQDVTVTYATQDGTAKAGTNYQPVTNGSVKIRAGDTSATFTINVIGGAIQGGNENFFVNLTGATNGVIRRARGTATIIDDAAPLPALSIGNVTVREGDFGTTQALFPVLLSNAHNRDVSVSYTTRDGTGRAGLDYVATSGTLTIPAGQLSGVIAVTVIGNRRLDGLKTFFVDLINPVQAIVADPRGTATIVDDDQRGSATKFLIRFTPQTGLGTYSYAIGPDVRDVVRTPAAAAGGANTLLTPSATEAPKVIPQSTTGLVTSRILVPQQAAGVRVSNVTVTLYISQKDFNFFTDPGQPAWTAGLRVTLIAPDGTKVKLFDQGQLSGRSLFGTTFDDTAAQPITAGTAPYSGRFRPVQALAAFNGKIPAGNWTLQIENDDPNTIGTLDTWFLDLGIGAPGNTRSTGNLMDQNANGITGEANVDQFAAPNPKNGIPFQLPYTADTLPLIVPGPHVLSTSVPGQAASPDNLVLNKTNDRIDVTFDRDIQVNTFTLAQVLRIVGPLGQIPLTALRRDAQGRIIVGPDGNPIIDPTVSVTPLDPRGPAGNQVARIFRVGFPVQTISGTYTLTLASTITSDAGDQLDTNLNAGLDVLRSTDPNQLTPRTPDRFASSQVVTLTPRQTVTSIIQVDDPFQILGLTLSLNILHTNVPDLVADLISPTGTVVHLFTNVGAGGPPPHANFTDTAFDDAAATPIQRGFPPFNVGPYNPQTPFADLNGQTSKGRWTLRITNTGATTGTLNRWSLTFQKPAAGTGLGETVADQANVSFRIFTQDQSNAQSHNTWTAVGPASQLDGGVKISSRIAGLALDPSDPSGNTAFVAGASGGVWKTNNFLTNDAGGPTYVPLTDFGQIGAINVGGVAVFPVNNDPRQSVVFVTTGEGDTGSAGVGLLRSRDGGATWTLLDSVKNLSASGQRLPQSARDKRFIGLTSFKVVAESTPRADGNLTIYAVFSGRAADAGIWRSDDTGDTWTLLRTGQATDLVFAAGSAGTDGQLQLLYGAFRNEGVFISPNRGATWNLLTGGQGNPLRRDADQAAGTGPAEIPVDAPAGTPNGAKGRITLAVPTFITGDPLRNNEYQGWLYALVSTVGDRFDGLYVSKDFGRNWTKVRIPNAIVDATIGVGSNDTTNPDHDPFGGGLFAQGNYDQSIAIDPNNPNVVYVGGTNDGTRQPAGGLIRVDTTGLHDGNALIGFDESNPDGGLIESATIGGATIKNFKSTFGLYDSQLFKQFGVKIPTTFNSQSYLNLLRDPDNPFLSDATLLPKNVGRFTNDGSDIKVWQPFQTLGQGSTDIHRLLTFRDPLTGLTRLIVGDDQGVFTGVDGGSGTLLQNIGGLATIPTGSRNGNLQITQMYFGATQPSVLAAELAGALFYSSDQDTGFPKSDPHILSDGNLLWVGPAGDGTGAATDPTGSGNFYQYQWPCCGTHGSVATNFFHVKLPNGNPNDLGTDLGRTNGLLQGGDDPGNGRGQWPFLGGANFAVNTINGQAMAISAPGSGRIFRTTDTGLNWFPIAEPGDVGGVYSPAIAFGAPETTSSNNLDNFIYAGNVNGQIFVTFTGGGSVPGQNAWKNISAGLDGSSVMQIVTNPKRGSHEAYAVTSNGVYFLADSSAAAPTWTRISGNLFSLQRISSYSPGDRVAWVQNLTTIQADWRFALPDSVGSSSTHPVLYIAGDGGVFRSRDKGRTWTPFPDAAVTGDGAPQDGGYLPVAHVTELELSQGNINPATGRPNDDRLGSNLLVAFTYGRGAFAIRLDNTAESGPAVVSAGPVAPGASVSQVLPGVAPGGVTAVVVTFNGPVDPFTFTVDDVRIFTGPNGQAITPTAVTDITPTPASGTNLHNVFRIDFPAQTTDGVYTISIGPRISDYAGNLMNQNGNAVNGEDPADRFTFQFAVNSTDNGQFLSGLYHDLLGDPPAGRPIDFGGFNNLLPTIDDPRFALLTPVASSFVALDSVRTQLISALYQSTLTPRSTLGLGDLIGAAATPADVSRWLAFLKGGGKPEAIIAELIADERYFDQNRPGVRVINGDVSAYVTQVFRELFGRDPSPEEQLRFVTVVNAADVAGRRQIGGYFITTVDYFQDVVRRGYNDYLRRAPSQSEIDNWVTLFRVNRLTEEQFFAALLSDPEYVANYPTFLGIVGPGTNETYVKSLYQDIFPGVVATPDRVAPLVQLLDAGTPRGQVVLALLSSDAFHAAPGIGQVDRLYQRFLQRAPTDPERAYWQGRFQQGLRLEFFVAELVSSEDYINLQRAGATSANQINTNWVNATYRDLFGRVSGPTGEELNANLVFLAARELDGRRTAATILTNAPEFLDRLTGLAYQNFLGRAAGAGEIAFWRTLLSTRGVAGRLSPVENLVANLLGSREYFSRQMEGTVDTNRAWVASLFASLQIPFDQAGADATLNNILAGYRPQRYAVATALVNSAEHRRRFILESYQTYLGRAPGAGEINFWQAQFQFNRITQEQLIANLLGSPDFFNRSPGLIPGNTAPASNATVIRADYLLLFGQSPTDFEVTFYLNRLNAGLTREQMANELLVTDRYRFAQPNGLVNTLYRTYLNRNATVAEINFWRFQYQRGLRTEALVADLVASSTYFLLPHTFP